MWIFIKTVIFTILLPGSVTVYIPYWLILGSWPDRSTGIWLISMTGLIPILLGVLIYLWCAWDFIAAGKGTPAPIDPPRNLVARGLYRHMRNPMYAGITLILIGESVLFGSLNMLFYAYGVFLLFNIFIVFYEEPALKRKFGERYGDYCEMVPRWVPKRHRS